MKKILSFVFAVLFAVAFVITASAQILTYEFNTSDSLSWITSRGSQCDASFDSESGYMKLTSKGNDPNIKHSFGSTPLDADTYSFVFYRFKVVEGVTESMPHGQFFFSTDQVSMGATGTHTSFDMSSSDKWQNVYYNLSELSEWSGDVTEFRLDHVQSPDSTFSVLVHSIAFCSTLEEVNTLNQLYPSEIDAPSWTFESYEKWKPFISSFNHLDYEVVDGYLTLYPTGNDPFMLFSIEEANQVYGDDNPWIAFRMKLNSTVPTGSIFFGTEETSLSSATVSGFDVIGDNEWHDYCIDMSSYSHGLWKSKIQKFRIDFINYYDADASITIDRAGIFSSEDDARAFLAKEFVCNVDAPFDDYINSGAEIPCWDFRTIQNVGDIWVDGGGLHMYENGLYVFNALNFDSMITNHFSDDECFDADEFYYLGVRLKNTTDIPSGVMYFTNDSNVLSYTDGAYLRVQHGEEGEWTDIIINAKKRFPEKWVGKITSIRFDILNTSATAFTPNSNVYVSRMGFFRDKEEALEYLNGGNEEPDYSLSATFRGSFQNAFIPGGTLSDGYSKKDYMLSSTELSGDGDNPIVLYTDNEGNTTPVALSNVNSGGFAHYVADKAGIYSLGYNAKTFGDTQGHWAEKYIGYVADREVFGGTSEEEFSPDMPMTRGMFATVLGRLQGINTEDYTYDCSYTDVNPSLYYAPYVKWITEQNIMLPDSDTRFSPESPIKRVDMAVTVANYISTYGYEGDYYNDVDSFTDISDYDQSVSDAIALLQKSGILKGRTSTEFDPEGISTRAETSAVIQRVIKAVTGSALPETEFTNEDITKKRIRLGVWGFSFSEKQEVDRLRDLGVNLICTGSGTASSRVWNLCDKYGIEIFFQDYPFGESYAENPVDPRITAAEYIEHPSFGGHFFIDEPGTDDFGWIGSLIDSYNESLPDKTAFVNLLPMYANAAQLKFGAGAAAIEYYDPDPDLYRKYCQEWFNTNNADYICTDIYPLNWTAGKKTTYNHYAESINQIATVARENDAEFWCCIQTYGWTASKRTPDESEFRWQCYSMLSYGCTGILLWSYTGGGVAFPSMIDMKTRELNQSYYDCQPVFAEMNAISDIYVSYKNLGAFTHNYSDSVPYLYMSGEYDINSTVFSDIECDNPLLFGYFEKISGNGNAFTVVNMTEFEDGTASTVKFKLRNSDKTVTSYHRGVESILTPVDGYYTIELEVGDGAFVTVS